MGANDRIETGFSKRLRRERDKRKLSQAQLAKILSDRGIPMYPTTVAKIEAGERNAKIDEICAIADLFEVGVDTLLGRTADPAADRAFTFNTLAGELEAASQLGQIQTNLMMCAIDLERFVLDEDEESLRATTIAIAENLGGLAAAMRDTQRACKTASAGPSTPTTKGGKK